MRTIRTTGQGRSRAVADAIEGVFVGELLAPSTALWLVSPWLSDIAVIDNGDGRFAALSRLPRSHIALVDALGMISASGCSVTVVARQDPTNANVLAKIRGQVDSGRPIRLVIDPNVHDKAMLTGRLLLSGSMNFTYGGTERNTESLSIVDDASQVGAAHLHFGGLYGAQE